MALLLQARHKWMVEAACVALGRDDQQTQLEDVFREKTVWKRLTDFLDGTSESRHICVFYQRPDVVTESGELVENAAADPVFIVSFGDLERVKSKGVYFLRPSLPGGASRPVKLDIATGDDLLFGELSGNPLESLDSALACVFLPYLSHGQAHEAWGHCSGDQRAEFLASFNRFSSELSEAVRSVTGGIELRSVPEVDAVVARVSSSAGVNFVELISSEPAVISAAEGLLDSWCIQIEAALDWSASGSSSGDVGPKSEIELWRGRMQKVTSIIEQLKTPLAKTVLGVLHAAVKTTTTEPTRKQTVYNTLRKYKQVDISLTETLNEAKDNVKYLSTLEKFIEPLYSSNVQSVVDTLPGLLNAVKMILTIARYYNSPERMTGLLAKITAQMIVNCKEAILANNSQHTIDALWDTDPTKLIKQLELCAKLHKEYIEQYKQTKENLQQTPKGRQFEFSETQIFGRFDLFIRRVNKLVDMFSTIHQFKTLATHKFDGMESLINSFNSILTEFRQKHHDLLDYTNNRFDRDYVEFNLRISDLESALQQFVNQSFESITSIEASLNLLGKFQAILQRDSLKQDLMNKYNLIFHNYGLELTSIQDQYEKYKSNPPISRNLPPVVGNITWARHLLRRIEEPMKRFQQNPVVLQGKDAKKVIRMYNKMARVLIEYEQLFYMNWVASIEQAKSGLSAPLIVKLAEDNGRLAVNLDPELMTLVKEAKGLERMGIEIPDAAKMVLLQERRYKRYFNELTYLLKELKRIQSSVKPIMVNLLRGAFEQMELVLKPGMGVLNWTSLNVDTLIERCWGELNRLEELVNKVNDIMEGRIEGNLRSVSKMLLIDLPDERQLVSLEDFVDLQERHVRDMTSMLMGKSVEVETAVNDMLVAIVAYKIDPTAIKGISESEIIKVKAHYNWSMYQALLNATKRSLQVLKNRMSARVSAAGEAAPFFEVNLQLDGIGVKLAPTVDDIQRAINGGAVAIMKCSKMIEAWDTVTVPRDVQLLLNPNLPPVLGVGSQGTYYDRIAQDKEILKAVLLLTGSVQNSKDECEQYLKNFDEFRWLWAENIDTAYKAFQKTAPTLDEFERKLGYFSLLQERLDGLDLDRQISALMIKTDGLKKSLKDLAVEWKVQFSKELHKDVKARLDNVTERIKQTMKRLTRPVEDGDIDALGMVMGTLNDVRKQQSEIELEFTPIYHMYAILDQYLPPNIIDKDEQDSRSMLKSNWQRLVDESVKRQLDLSVKQQEYKSILIQTIQNFKKDVKDFRKVYEERGPMVVGIPPREAVERLKRFKEEFDVRSRKQEIYFRGEDLFGLPHQQYPQLDQTRKELGYLGQLYDLYVQVLETLKEWKEYLWLDVPNHIEAMKQQVDNFSNRCKKMPKQLREWPAYQELKKEIEDFSEALPLLVELAKKSVMPRHWEQVMSVTGQHLPVESDMFRLQSLIDANIVNFKEDIADICESADKQLIIEQKLTEYSKTWAESTFDFNTWKQRDYACVLAGGRVAEIQEQLEEALMGLNTINAMRHSVPFKDQLTTMITTLSDSSDVIERWVKTQMLWTSLESVFTGGDIAKQMPVEAKRFSQIDKDWLKIMAKSAEIRLVIPCCQNDMLKQLLPVLGQGLESCQKSLESYLEGKRNKFPRFYFVSDPVLLKILSQGSEPENIQDDFEKLFDSISRVHFDKNDKKKITKIKTIVGTAEEVVDLVTPVNAVGQIETWLGQLEQEMQKSVRRECRSCAHSTGSLLNGMSVTEFTDKFISQVALLGIQMVWTADFQEALVRVSREKDRTVMASTNKKFQQLLNDLVAACLTDLGSSMNRTKYETLITVHVHQRDLFTDIWKKVKEHKLKDESDFEWLKQTRFYWKTETDHASVSIADVDFTYSYEYLGVKERLVITPLTDRCYITLSQALSLFFGGAPAGPAGTGKTETTKDMARTLGCLCLVTNCSDQHRYRDMAKIFKGLCQSGTWGCFDEFNRIELEVLSVVAMQVEAINMAKRQNFKQFTFPGESIPIRLILSTGAFITMNPGYAGRQELPENLKCQFRGVSMMLPDRELIMKTKLAASGYQTFDILGKKFNVLYKLCEQQLSKQRHYDFGLRNILSVLRTAGGVKRSEAADTDEEMIFMRTARDMNLSKLVADDVPLFLALLKDLFPRVQDPPKKVYADVEEGIAKIVKQKKLVAFEPWKLKVIQLYETSLVRHGIMLVGLTLSGKSECMQALTQCLTDHCNSPHRIVSMNPKAITDSQMYGVKDPVSDEWTPGVFASIWAKFNNRSLKYTTWIVCDGPVDAIWIENLNTVLDDNKILTLANNDRIPMTDNCRILFEVEDLNNASPATVSRAGIIFVSPEDLGWEPIVESWLSKRTELGSIREQEKEIITALFQKFIKDPEFVEWWKRNLTPVMAINPSMAIVNTLNLLAALLQPHARANEVLTSDAYKRLFVYALTWGFGGLLDSEERRRFHDKIAELSKGSGADTMPPKGSDANLTLFDYVPDWRDKSKPWIQWQPESWKAPKKLQFSSLLIPTVDSVRAEYLLQILGDLDKSRQPPHFKSVLLCGAGGTAKTSTISMYLSKFKLDEVLSKRINFSSATTPFRFQKAIEAEVERKTGKTFCPPGGKRLVVAIDDLSMPLVNKWGDQITLEIVRQLIENSGFYFLDKDKRGDFKTIEGLQFVGSMGHPGGGRNDIPNRAKSKFFAFNMVMPNLTVVDGIYGNILRAKLNSKNGTVDSVIGLIKKVTIATIDIWNKVKTTLLPTPQRFHYVFNMRELSRVFQGIMETPLEVLNSDSKFVSLWRHECTRVFADKLSRQVDKDFVEKTIQSISVENFGEKLTTESSELIFWADFQRPAPLSEEGDELPPPKVYEPVVGGMDAVRKLAYAYLNKFNETFPAKAMNLVLFDDAMGHLMRITRTIQQKRGSAMLVGVGGSGKQSLTRLASFICRQRCFQVAITKTYNDNAFFDDLRGLFVDAGQKGNPVTFLFTDAEIKSENFLEYMNSILATGEVAGLFQKDERDSMSSEVRNDFVKDRPGMEDNLINLYEYFTDRLRDNLHIVLCFSPVNSKFPIRAQRFPAIFNAVNINWFLPWPKEALIAVSSAFLSKYEIDTPTEKKAALYQLMGAYHASVNEVCGLYYQRMRRHVYVTPKSFLCLVDFYKQLYRVKYDEVNVLERAVNVGLKKLNEAATDVEKMKIALKEEEKNLKVAEEQANKLLVKVQAETVKGEAKAAEVGKKKDSCLAKKAEIEHEQAEANKDLQAALPFLHEAESAVKSITAKDIQELKTLKAPSDIIRLVFDGVIILRQMKLCDIRAEEKTLNKMKTPFIHDSYDEFARPMLSDIKFLPDLFDFSAYDKDNINDETCEFLEAYIQLENFNSGVAKKASGAAEGLCKWVIAMSSYHTASKIVKPKMDFLRLQTAKLDVAMKELAGAEAELAAAMAVLDALNQQFNEAMASKATLEQKANATRRKMEQANNLINGLAGEKTRWTEDSNNFADRRKKLVGDVAMASAFVTYCGPFNSEFRDKLVADYFKHETIDVVNVPVNEKLDLVHFLVDQGTVGEWALQGLPSDDLSVQNAIMTTRSSRYPLMIDPQGQAIRWIKSKESQRIGQAPQQCMTTLTNPRLKDQLEFTMSEGLCLLIENVENEVDPLLDPVMDKAIIKKGKNLYITVGDQNMDYNPKFMLYMTSRLPNPHFSPELSAKCTVIDFTVTLKGLEQQLLGRVLGMEQRALEESLAQLMEEVTNNTKALKLLDEQLLDRLSNSSGNLLDDVELVEVLANTKAKAKEVEHKLMSAEEKKVEINQKRELYRPVATRGSVMYFCMTDMTNVSNPITMHPTGWMYNCSLLQFLGQFDLSVKQSEKNAVTQKRVEKIIDYLTYQIYRYMNRGLFERDKMMFKLMVALKIMTVASQLSSNDVGLLLKGGSALDSKSERPNPYRWLPDKVWLNILQLSRHSFGVRDQVVVFRDILDCIQRNEAAWRKWYDENEPESVAVPDYEERIQMEKVIGPFLRLVLVRGIREDRTTVSASEFINQRLDPRFTKPVTDSIDSIFDESSARRPVLYLLSAGSDPTSMIDELAKKRKKFPTDKVSMGEGQEVIAWEKMKNGFINGSWVILQNCHLGLGFMNQMEDILTKTTEIDEDFRLWITCEITNRFPIGLLQMSIKVTMEPPMGLKAGLYRTYTTIVSQKSLDKIDHEKWRSIVFVQAFLHSIVQERRKFGAIGWCIPYEFNNSDLEASLLFLEKHFSTTLMVGQPLSWATIQYMVAEVQYGGRITDDLDRELFNTYASRWLCEEAFSANFNFSAQGDFKYLVPSEGATEIVTYRDYIEKMPPVDSPNVFGLHTNADLTYRQLEASMMLTTIQETQPKESSAAGGKSRDDIVKDKANEILAKMPADFVEEQFRLQIAKLKGPPNTTDKGFAAPLNIFLFQELQRLQRVISIVRTNLTSMVMAIDGTVVMTPSLLEDLDMVYDARIPKSWTHDPSGAEISWLVPNLGAWFTGLLDRVQQLSTWLESGRGAMKGYWLTGFLNAQGFLTGMRQEVTRQHKKDQWALDDVVTSTEVLPYDLERVKDVPDEGQNIYGLFIEGARWNRQESRLDESEPKKLFTAMPVIYVTAVTSKEKKAKENYGQYAPYDCAVYKYPRRTDRYLIFRILLKTEQPATHWRLRGVALLCSTE